MSDLYCNRDYACEHGCCWIHVRLLAPGVTAQGHAPFERTCNYCDEPREPRECGEPCEKCGGRPEE